MPVPTVSFDPAEASLRVDLSPTFGISVSFPKGNKSEPTFSVHRGPIEYAPDDLSRSQFCDLVNRALR